MKIALNFHSMQISIQSDVALVMCISYVYIAAIGIENLGVILSPEGLKLERSQIPCIMLKWNGVSQTSQVPL